MRKPKRGIKKSTVTRRDRMRACAKIRLEWGNLVEAAHAAGVSTTRIEHWEASDPQYAAIVAELEAERAADLARRFKQT